MKKTCPVCGKTNSPNATHCEGGCGASLGGNTQMVDNAPVQKGKQGNPLVSVVPLGPLGRSAQNMPTSGKLVKMDVPHSFERRTKKFPDHEDLSDEALDQKEASGEMVDLIKRKQEPSDEDTGSIDDNQLQQMRESGNDLCL